MKALLKVTVLLTLALCFFAATSQAQRRIDKGASNKGFVNPSGGCNTAFNNLCVSFTPATGTTPAHFTSLNPFNNPVQDGPYDLFTVPTANPVTFTVTDPNLAFGSFLCGGFPDLPAGACTDLGSTLNNQLSDDTTIGSSQSLIASFFSSPYPAPVSGNIISLAFNHSNANLPSNWVFYATEGEATLGSTTGGGGGGGAPVPEPASLILLGSSLFALAGLKRRRSNPTASADANPAA